MEVKRGYDFNNNPGTIKQETIISSIIEGRLVPRDLSKLEELESVASGAYIYVDDGGKATKLALTDITTGAIKTVNKLPVTAEEDQIVLLELDEGQYEFYKFTEEGWIALHIMSDADIVNFSIHGSTLTAKTVQGAIDELSGRVDDITGGSVHSINDFSGDVIITGTDGKLIVDNHNNEINLDVSSLALNSDLDDEIARAQAAEEQVQANLDADIAAEQARADAHAEAYTDEQVAILSNDVYHKAEIKEIALTGEAVDVHVNDLFEITSNELQEVLRQINAKAGSGGVAIVTEKKETPDEGFAITYQVLLNGASTGVNINIPKDYVLRSATLETCLQPDVPVVGYVLGENYLDFAINDKENTEPIEHLYTSLKSLQYKMAENARQVQLNVSLDSEGNKILGANIVSGSLSRNDMNEDLNDTFDQVDINVADIEALNENKVDKEEGHSLMSDAEHEKLAGIEAGAEVNVHADWEEIDPEQDSFIENKPELADVALSGEYDDLLGKPIAGDGISIAYDSEGNLVIENTRVSAEWGNIVGTLADQADLKNALDSKVDKVAGSSLMTDAEHSKLAGIQANAQVNLIDSVDEHFSVEGKQLQLNNIEVSKVTGLADILDTKVDKVTDHSLVSDSEIAKLATVSQGATKTEFSSTNGNLIIDGREEAVYTAPVGSVVDANYKHIDVTATSISDGEVTFNKYDDTALAARVSANEAAIAGLDGDKQDELTPSQLNAVNSGVTANKVTNYDAHVANGTIHVTQNDKDTWNAKQDALGNDNKLSTDYISGLSTVAISGDYDDLLNKPTIPVVNNAKLTIQKNGTTVSEFTANANEAVTANIAVPVAVSELTNDSNYTTTTALNNAVNSIEGKLNRDVLTDVSFEVVGQAANLNVTKSKYNLSTQQASETVVTAVAIADEDNAGLMSSYDVLTLADLKDRVASLEGANTRLLYDVEGVGHHSNPTYTDINDFVVSLGKYEAPFMGITVIVSDTQHAWRYYLNLSDQDSEGHYIDTPSAWRDDGVETVSNFSNNTPGLIKGAGASDGQVYAETNGTGSVYGWDTLKARVTTLENNSATRIELGTLSDEVEGLESSKQDTLESGTNIKTINNTSLLGSGNITIDKAAVGLNNVDNTSDLNKPISTATQTALNGKQAALNGTSGATGQNLKAIKVGSGSAQTLLGTGSIDVGSVTSVTIGVNAPLAINSSGAITSSGSRTISHNTSGVSAGSYGDTTDQTPAYNSTFKVPFVKVDSYGHVTEASEHTVKIPASDNVDTTYTFENGVNGFTVTPSVNGAVGTGQTVQVIPSITNNITGTGTRTAGYLAKFNTQNTIENGPAISSTGSASKFLNEQGNWVQISEATSSAAGLMSATDKTKFDATILGSNEIKLNKISAPTAAGGSTYSNGTNGQILRTNGTNMYWADLPTYTAAAGKGLKLNNTAFEETSGTVTILATDWVGDAFPYSAVKNLAGVYASSEPVLDVDMSGVTAASDIDTLNEAWSKIYRAVTSGTTASNGQITFYASEKPSTDITVLVKGF